MQNAFLEFRGSFTYRNQAAIDTALCDARAQIETSDVSESDSEWMRYVWRSGMTLHIDAILPESTEQRVAAAILGALSRQAIAGRVQVTRLNHCLDAIEPDGSVTAERRDDRRLVGAGSR